MNKKIIGATSLLAATLIAGSFLSISGASAATRHASKPSHTKVTPTPAPSAGTTTPPTRKKHTPETLVTGDALGLLTEASLAAYPNATILRVENDTDGAVYEVHLTSAAGEKVTLLFDANYTITSTLTGGRGFGAPGNPKGPHGHKGFDHKGGRGGHKGLGDNDADDAGTSFTPPAPVTPINP